MVFPCNSGAFHSAVTQILHETKQPPPKGSGFKPGAWKKQAGMPRYGLIGGYNNFL
jgi:hypothetical protein